MREVKLFGRTMVFIEAVGGYLDPSSARVCASSIDYTAIRRLQGYGNDGIIGYLPFIVESDREWTSYCEIVGNNDKPLIHGGMKSFYPITYINDRLPVKTVTEPLLESVASLIYRSITDIEQTRFLFICHTSAMAQLDKEVLPESFKRILPRSQFYLTADCSHAWDRYLKEDYVEKLQSRGGHGAIDEVLYKTNSHYARSGKLF